MGSCPERVAAGCSDSLSAVSHAVVRFSSLSSLFPLLPSLSPHLVNSSPPRHILPVTLRSNHIHTAHTDSTSAKGEQPHGSFLSSAARSSSAPRQSLTLLLSSADRSGIQGKGRQDLPVRQYVAAVLRQPRSWRTRVLTILLRLPSSSEALVRPVLAQHHHSTCWSPPNLPQGTLWSCTGTPWRTLDSRAPPLPV